MYYKTLFSIYLFLISIFITPLGLAQESSPEPDIDPEETFEDINAGYCTQYCTQYGTWIYAGHPTVEYHLEHVAEDASRKLYWLFEYGWRAKKDQEQLLKLPSTDEEYTNTVAKIIDNYQEIHRLGKAYYNQLQKNIIEYVNPEAMPKNLAWEIAKNLALYVNAEKDLALWRDGKHIDNQIVKKFYEISLLYFAYALDITPSTPPILHYSELDPIAEISVEESFRKLSQTFDEAQWVKKLEILEHKPLDNFALLLRPIYLFFLEHQDTLSPDHLTIAAHLNSVLIRAMFSAQKNINFNIDAVNPWMFKLYIDLKKWQSSNLIINSDLQNLIERVETQCLRFLPDKFLLTDINDETEFAICEEVRKGHLLPENQGFWDDGKEIVDEFEFSPTSIRWNLIYTLYFLDEIAKYSIGYHVNVKDMYGITHQIYNYLCGYVEIQDLPITPKNAIEYLMQVKIFDMMINVWNSHYPVDYEYYGGMQFGYRSFGEFYFERSSYELRKHILKLCPHLTSYEVLTVSVNPEKVNDEKDELSSEEWIEESEAIRCQCIKDLSEGAKYLADRMNQDPSLLKRVIVGARGISGAGKSTFLKKHILPLVLNADETDTSEIEALAKGILNPDTLKAALRKMLGDALNTQVHSEGISAFNQLFNEVADTGSYILDRRLLTPHEILTDLVEPAKKSGSFIWLFDLDIPIDTCITRILARPLSGEEPCPEYQALINGYRTARRYRSQIVKLVTDECSITKYELYATSAQRLIANKAENGHLLVHDPILFEECLREPTDQEIDDDLSQVIDSVFIDHAIDKNWIKPAQRELLEKWLGMTLKESIQRHVQGIKDSTDESLFEAPIVTTFNGQEWLADYPEVISFLQSEHFLHLRGIDKNGRGLHWEIDETERGLNPKYNPESCAAGADTPGIQMKLGYFIIPMNKLDLYLSEKLSPMVTRELTIRDEKGELFGLRFFVHPEAYAHFAPLLREGFIFVSPSESEFMGSPTSSYNSWLIRNISTPNRIPFIVKMGTPNGQSDIRHLLTGDEVVRNLIYQKHIDTLPETEKLVLFKETAGLVLYNIPNYPKGTVDSGIIIAELPESLLSGECTLLSLSALMSAERVKLDESKRLPLIYELIETAVQKGFVKNSEEFVKTYLIDTYLEAIEALVFKEGYSLPGKNLYLMINSDNEIKGFAYRDLSEVRFKKKYLESYSWSYRYASLIKLFNVLTRSETEDEQPLLGAPIRAGTEKASNERNLYYYLYHHFIDDEDIDSLEILNRLSITPETRKKLLLQADGSYLNYLKRYFSFKESELLQSDGSIPCAEKGSKAAKEMIEKDRIIIESKFRE